MIVNFPSPSPGNITGLFLVQVLETLKRAFLPVLTKDEAAPRVLLQDPDGGVWAVTVGNTGTLTTTLVDGKTREI